MKKCMALLLCLLFCFCAFAAAEEDTCPACGAKLGDNYCENCGTAEPGTFCPGCGRLSLQRFCPACGAKLPAPAAVYADIVIRDYGTVTFRLETEKAPITCANFISLAESGFYNGLTFHRIIAGFMMQGGDPNGNGTGGSGRNIPGEFAINGYNTGLSHTRGAVSMARASDPNSASSQFFIMHVDYPYLDGQYAVFGYVTEGMEVVDAVCAAAKPVDSNGTIPRAEQPVIESVTIRYE